MMPPAAPMTHSPSLMMCINYTSLVLQVKESEFPGRAWTALDPAQRDQVTALTDLLLVGARWRLESPVFAELFAQPSPNAAPVPADLVAVESARTGMYL